MKRRGLSLLETMISAVLLGILTSLLFFVYRMGASSLMKGQAQTELLQDVQASSSRLLREIERSTYASLSLDPPPPGGPATAISLLSAIDPAGQFAYDPAVGEPTWQKYVVLYYDAPSEELRWREVVLAAGSPEARTPGPIEQYQGSALATYRNGGRTIARHVTRCELSFADGTVTLLLETQRKRYGSEQKEQITLRSSGAFRN